MDPTTIATDVAAKTLEAAYKNRSQIVTALKSGLDRLKDGKTTVAIFGPGGVGKSTTQTLLCDGLSKAEKNMSYLPTVDATKRKSKNNWSISVWDTPGQEDFRDAAWSDVFNGMTGSRRCIFINIVSYGYNSTGAVPYAELKKISSKKGKSDVVRNYTRIERKKELDLISDLSEQIQKTSGKVQLLTIVNKQDLWWSQRTKVLRHYSQGAYANVISAIAAKRHRVLFSHSLKEVSLCPVNLKTIDGVDLAQTCQGYDASTREYFLTHLLGELKQIVG